MTTASVHLRALAASFAAALFAVAGCAPEAPSAPLHVDPATDPSAALATDPSAALATGPSAPAVPGTTASWSASVGESIAASEYAPQVHADGFRVTNRAQRLNATFGPAGLTVQPEVGGAEVGLELQAWGREAALIPVEPTLPEEGPCIVGGAADPFGDCLRRVDYAHPGLTEWWENRPEGLEQGFTVTAPPDGEGALVFELAVRGARPEVEDTEARLVTAAGDPLRYAQLAAWDERGRELPAWLEPTDSGLRIRVDDTGAIGTITVDPILTTEAWSVEGGMADAYFGGSVASAGDVNGDGYGDVIVGAYLHTNGQANEGRAYVYNGSASGLSAVPSWTQESNDVGAKFGYQVASAGDVNGDGFGDVVVGAPYYTNGQTDEGRIFLYYGAATGLETAARTLESNEANSKYGISAASAGDFNGDGYGDLLVGAPAFGTSDTGKVYLYLGSHAGIATDAAVSATSEGALGYYGSSVASAGDVNGDGYGDVVIGSENALHNTYTLGYNSGRAAVCHGSGGGSLTEAWSQSGWQTQDKLGNQVASAGDVNGDGYGDLIVGWSNYNIEEGAFLVYLGSSSGLTTGSFNSEATSDYDYLGVSVASAGDVNGDGYGDVIVGASGAQDGQSDEGLARLYLGSSSGITYTSSYTQLEVNQSSASFGASVASAGDVNGDGFGDVIVGAPYFDHGYTNEGAAFTYLGSPSGLGTSAGWTAESDVAHTNFGYSVAPAGDVNGDGYGDVVVGAPYFNSSFTDEGKAFVYLGAAAGLATSAAWTALGGGSSALFGASVASAGDVNADGYGDVLIGAPEYRVGSVAAGRASLYHGSSSGLNTSPAWTEESDQAGAALGGSVASAGDVNGDGYGDLLVGADSWDNGATDEGAAFLYLGNSGGVPAASADWTAESDQVSACFGQSVASAGDVNGDGYGDVIVGANYYDNGQTNEGRAFVYHGSPLGLEAAAAWTAESGAASANFGFAVSAAGDVNGDGYGDVVVGAHDFVRSGTEVGGAYVYHGSGSGLGATAAWNASATSAFDFGYSVAAAGDVNGDGYGDVVVGAIRYANGSAEEGGAFVYHGAATGLGTTEAWSEDSDQTNAHFGKSVASAGDVNGDGYADLIVGAEYYESPTSTTNEGKAFLYYGNAGDGATPLARAPQARRTTGSTPIVAGLASNASSSFNVAMIKARGAWGRAKVKLQVEAKPVGTAFDYTGFTTSSSFTSTGLTGATITETISGLVAGTGYHWRARVLASAAEGRPQGWGPWVYGGLSGDANTGHVFIPGGTTYYADADGDTYGDSAVSVTARAGYVPTGYVTNDDDCNDGLSGVYLGAPESVANGVDEDCDGVDSCYADTDGDNYGTTVRIDGSSLNCGTGTGAPVSTDCDDTSSSDYPGAPETVGNGNDEDCDNVDSCYTDADNDGYGTTVVVDGSSLDCSSGTGAAVSTDCDDTSAEDKPLATEIVANGDDEDCDNVDSCYWDSDNDGYGTTVVVAGLSTDCGADSNRANDSTDCDDLAAADNPAATEIVANNNDEDCDNVDSCYTDADNDGYGTTVVVDGSTLSCIDGTGATVSTDCDDATFAYNPGASEIVADRIDQDCNTFDSCYTDTDNDGFGTTVVVDSTSSMSCANDPGRAALSTDCDDTSAADYPGATEIVANGNDEDCDTFDSCYTDADNDGYGTTVVVDGSSLDCDSGTGAPVSTDCDDTKSAYNPGASEIVADSIDQDCDTFDSCYTDNDNDGYGTTVVVDGTSMSCVTDAYRAARSTDCSDTAASVNPGVPEVVADFIDQDCDTFDSCYTDADDDGYGTTVEVDGSSLNCISGSGAIYTGDCDDTSSTKNPDSSEIVADGLDQNCDGFDACYTDTDGDSFGTTVVITGSSLSCGSGTGAANDDDCNDSYSSVYPGATETVADFMDQDCDGFDACYADADRDNYGTTVVVDGSSLNCIGGDGAIRNDDCDDSNSSYYPGASDAVADGFDQDCDGVDSCYTDADGDNHGTTVVVDGSSLSCATGTGSANDDDCNDTTASYYPGAPETPADNIDQDCDLVDSCYTDADGDGYGTTVVSNGDSLNCLGGIGADNDDDCDDSSSSDKPGGTEIVANDDDEDCDGVDSCYTDADGDNYGTSVVIDGSSVSCSSGTGAPNATDCDDTSAADYPGAAEVTANGNDENCDTFDSCYTDADGDNYGTTVVIVSNSLSCAAGTGAAVSTDCDDTSASISPSGTEIVADFIDQDCDFVDSCYTDADGDAYGSTAVSDGSSLNCLLDTGATNATDCDDTSASDYPGATEIVANADDEDCDGVDSCYSDNDNDNYGTSVVVDGSSLSCDAGSGSLYSTDCNDTVATVYPGATETVGDFTDQDCDSFDACYTDADGDNYGTSVVVDGSTTNCISGTGALVATDCDDTSATAYPGASETVADGTDQDCDSFDSCYTDTDGDNYGTTVVIDGSSLSCAMGTGAAVSTDCNDASALVFPGATETVADFIDQDCDSFDACYTDADNDNYGTSVVVDGSSLNCITGTGAIVSTDCDDTSALSAPGATETVADGVDQDCDSFDSCYTDADADGYGTTVVVDGSSLNCVTGTGAEVSTDCNDARASVSPGGTEIVADYIDQDCDNVDTCYTDADSDGYGTSVLTAGSSMNCVSGTGAANAEDCDDTSSTDYPGATETVADGDDEDCDRVDSCYTDTDGDDYGTSVVIDGSSLSCATGIGAPVSTDCDDAAAADYPGAAEVVANGNDEDCDSVDSCYTDADGDNYGTSVVVDGSSLSCSAGTGSAVSTDCDDASVGDYPGATEIAANGDDEDCDSVDSCYTDADRDGYGTSVVIDGVSLICATSKGEADDASDCDDASSTDYPGASEDVANGDDEDCDGVDSCYTDADGDNYGTTVVVDGSTLSCDSGTGALFSTDCSDTSATVYPGAAEVVADFIDQDCNSVDDCYTDADGDNYGTSVVVRGSSLNCITDSGAALVATDCNDLSATVYPGATEVTADGIDQNCDSFDACYTDADADGYGSTVPMTGSSGACTSGTGGAPVSTDCNDAVSSINPGATEVVADYVDQDCDLVDACYTDTDDDGYGTTVVVDGSSLSCLSGTGAITNDDCDDASSSDRPGAAEIVANDDDEDCDGVDSCYTDADGDNYGTSVVVDGSSTSCNSGTGSLNATDCDDTSASDYPGAAERVANGNDEDCDNLDSCYTDVDGDNYGTSVVVDGSSLSCESGSGAANAMDCDDTSSLDYPGATEVVANGDDEDCDSVDSCYTDADGDNYGTSVVVDGSSIDCTTGTGAANATDCDDSAAADYPGAAEIVANGNDEDCDSVDSCYTDADGDNYGTSVVSDGSSLSCVSGTGAATSNDCDDADSGDYAGASEVTANDDDEDCDGVDSCYLDADDDGHGVTVVLDGLSLNCDDDGDYVASSATDCDDTSPSEYPGAPEIVADGVDQDCDSVDSCYTDADGDGYGTTVVVDGSSMSCEAGTGASVNTDCNDGTARVSPGAAETVADGTDQDCDGFDACYTDADGDNYGTTVVVDGSSLSCATGTGAAVSTDCNDASAAVSPAGTEIVADGTDQDCDTFDACYTDADGDNYGTSVVVDGSSLSCATGTGAAVASDCDDTSSAAYPGAPDAVADGVDQDCDAEESCYVDDDLDGARSEFVVASPDAACTGSGEALVSADLDCDDADGDAYPAATEIVGSGVDENCDGAEICFADQDDDGYRPDATSTVDSDDNDCSDRFEALLSALTGDCDDASTAYNPGALELDCADPNDYNCDSSTGFTDGDGDGFGACEECDDRAADVFPGSAEIAGDGIDGDCDGVDICYVDADLDAYGATTMALGTTVACTASGESSLAWAGDCDDADDSVHPGATETVGDAFDMDCDGAESCFLDADADGHRSEEGSVLPSEDTDCDDAAEALASATTDCDDTNAGISPSAVETIGDEIDADCDDTEICFVDGDADGFRPDDVSTVASADVTCVDVGEALEADPADDCDDADASVNPDALELPGDELDGDCDSFEICYADADADGYRGDDEGRVDSTDADCADAGEARATTLTGDCDPASAAYHPGADESDCGDPADYNCDGSVGFIDEDGDGWAACEDCDDAAFAVHPDAIELAGDLVDQDCDLTELCYVDADDDGFRPVVAATISSVHFACDGVAEALATDPADDCDDADAAVNAGATEIPGDERDQDCDDTELCYIDLDGDGYTAGGGATLASVDLRCDGTAEATASDSAGDCNDANAAYNPTASEVDCTDPSDYNCDGSSGATDADGDRFSACEECDDAVAAVNPNASEVCNAIDDDCDGGIDNDAIDADTWYADADADGFTDPDVSVDACEAPVGYRAATDADCDDADALSFPGSDDTPDDGVDQDCDGEDTIGQDDDTGGEADSGEACGCTSAGGGGVAWSWVLGVLVLAAQRRRAA